MIDRLIRRVAGRRMLALIAGLVMIVLVVSTGAAKSTLAGWSANDSSTGNFSAGSVGSVQNLQCVDSKNVLGTGLLSTEVRLRWNPPSGIDPAKVEYIVTWAESGLLAGSGTSPPQSTTEYTYKASHLTLVTLNVKFTVRARLKSTTWESSALPASATSIGLVVISVYLKCN